MEPIDLRQCELAAKDLSVHDALVLIGDYIVNNSGDEDRPGMVAALGCMLSINDIDASDVWIELIAHRDRETHCQSIATWVQGGSVYRVEYDRTPRGPYFSNIVFVEAADIRDAVPVANDGYATVTGVRLATLDDVDEIYELSKKDGSLDA